MKFKEFLINESGDSDSGSDWFYGNSLYPSDAFDYENQFSSPGDFLFLKSRWQKERDNWGRKFYGLDPESCIKSKFTSIESQDMPNNKKWKNNNNKNNIKINKNASLEIIGISKKSNLKKILWKNNDSIDKTNELNKLFGKFEPNFGNLSPDFDRNWSPYSGVVKMKPYKQKKWDLSHNNFPQK